MGIKSVNLPEVGDVPRPHHKTLTRSCLFDTSLNNTGQLLGQEESTNLPIHAGVYLVVTTCILVSYLYLVRIQYLYKIHVFGSMQCLTVVISRGAGQVGNVTGILLDEAELPVWETLPDSIVYAAQRAALALVRICSTRLGPFLQTPVY